MKLLTRPTKTVADFLNILKSDNIREDTILDIDSATPILIEREDLYITKILDNSLFQITREQSVSTRVDKDKMVRFYEYRLLEKSNGRLLYDELIMSAPYNICPYCTVGKVKTLDHFLPKSEYPSYSITPINLVPCCRDCNTYKKISFPTTPDNQTFHPYFDDVENDIWIKATLMQTEPLSFQFEVINVPTWSLTKMRRAHSHFNSYNINELFSSEADRELRAIQHSLKELYLQDKTLLKLHLTGTYESSLKGLGLLDWKTLMYYELSVNNWFLDGCNGVDFFN